jgi:hypothetical protein
MRVRGLRSAIREGWGRGGSLVLLRSSIHLCPARQIRMRLLIHLLTWTSPSEATTPTLATPSRIAGTLAHSQVFLHAPRTRVGFDRPSTLVPVAYAGALNSSPLNAAHARQLLQTSGPNR